MPQKKKSTKRRATRRAKKQPPREYVMPKTAAEQGIDCAICHAPAIWFDYGRAQRDHRAGFVCDDHPAIGQREKLLVKDQSSEQAA
jgi:ribosomal protein L32